MFDAEVNRHLLLEGLHFRTQDEILRPGYAEDSFVQLRLESPVLRLEVEERNYH